MKRGLVVVLGGVAFAAFSTWAADAQQPAGDGARYNGASMVRPATYREWTFLGAGLGMTYDPAGGSSTAPKNFTNVFVNPSAYRAFAKDGKWPNGTVLLLEIRAAATEGSINKGGNFQTDLRGLEAHVKDSRFAGGWAFFNFSDRQGLKDSAEPLNTEQAQRCVECHTEHGAVDTTFVQFYPTLIEVAKRAGTYKH
jgi:hypothetical protein